MEIIYPEDPYSFLQMSQKTLEEDEVNANLILGICSALVKSDDDYSRDSVFYSIVYNDNEISLIGLMTPPKNLLLYGYRNLDDNAMTSFTKELYSRNKSIPGITGESSIAKSFAEKWAQTANCNYKINVNLRIYKLTEVNNYDKPNGIFRNAEKEDVDVIIKYITEFGIGIHEPVDIEHAKEIAENGITNNEIFVWEDNGIVSMAKKSRPTKNGMAISYVYTPIEYRNRGYATAVVSELSQNILDSGKSFCTLYTDLSNPTSNSIYQKIGFDPVCEHISYAFEYISV